MKRTLEGEFEQSAKRVRLSAPDRFSALSDELLLRIVGALPPSQVCNCQRLSRRFEKITTDASVWRRLYFDRFVRPRSCKLPGLRGGGSKDVQFSVRPSKWLDEHHLVAKDAKTDWKQQFRLRHNWSRGTCDVDEITVAEQPHVPPMVVQMHEGVIFTADAKYGLRVWPPKGPRKLLTQISVKTTSPPTALCVGEDDSGAMIIAVGYENGRTDTFRFQDGRLEVMHTQEATDGVISSLALAWPFLLNITATQRLSLYKIDEDMPTLIHSLKAHNVWTPLSVSLRFSTDIIISIAYALPTYLSGWTVGVQEIRLSKEGSQISSRTASAIDQHYRPLAFTALPMLSHLRTGRPGLNNTSELRHIHSKPNSLSYTHPYLLVSHPDNTLTLYLVFSDTDTLSISAGSRLWGHTSSVSGAHVGGRGKAVSVSRRGDELRIWELEGGFSSDAARKRLASGDLSVRVKTPVSQSGLDVLTNSSEEHADELTITRGWIGFDAENVAVLKEESSGKQSLVVYDFT